ncbi:hypothetical protein [Methanolobus sp. ZRKC5]|uniref:hypothetical protein n=1 Tax=unclassified Methanolobus TaxID=2629569 RepID=UPI00313C1ED2
MEIDIKRGYDILPDNNITFGIRITNNTDLVISDVQIILDYNESLFKSQEDRIQKLASIPPSTAITAKFTLKPTGCILNEKIGASIIYRDPKWEKHMVDMRPKEVHCICPFLRAKPITKNEFLQLSGSGYAVESSMNFEDMNIEQITSFLMQTCATHLYIVDEYTIAEGNVLHFSGEVIGENNHYLLTALIKENEGLTQVMLRAVSDKKDGIQGFLNEMLAKLKHLANTVNSAKEIGVIKNKQVVNVLDSVVKRSNSSVENTKSPVNIKNSIVQQPNTYSTRNSGIDQSNNHGKNPMNDEAIAGKNNQNSQDEDVAKMYDTYRKEIREKQNGTEEKREVSIIPYSRNPAPSDKKLTILRSTAPPRKKEKPNLKRHKKNKKEILMQMLFIMVLAIVAGSLMQIPIIKENIGGRFGSSDTESNEVKFIAIGFLNAVNESQFSIAFSMYQGKDLLVPASVEMLFSNEGIKPNSIKQIDIVSNEIEDDTAVMALNCTVSSVDILGKETDISVIPVYLQLHDIDQGWTVTSVSFIQPYDIESSRSAEVV